MSSQNIAVGHEKDGKWRERKENDCNLLEKKERIDRGEKRKERKMRKLGIRLFLTACLPSPSCQNH